MRSLAVGIFLTRLPPGRDGPGASPDHQVTPSSPSSIASPKRVRALLVHLDVTDLLFRIPLPARVGDRAYLVTYMRMDSDT